MLVRGWVLSLVSALAFCSSPRLQRLSFASISPKAVSTRCRSRSPDFIAADPALGADRARHRRRHPRRSRPLGLFRAIAPPLISSASPIDRAAALSRLERDCRKRWSSARPARLADGRIRIEFRLWDVLGANLRHRVAVFDDAGQLAPHRAQNRGQRSMSSSPASAAISTPASSSSRKPARAPAASSA